MEITRFKCPVCGLDIQVIDGTVTWQDHAVGCAWKTDPKSLPDFLTEFAPGPKH